MQSKRGLEPAQYMSLSQDHLVAVALWYLSEEGRQASFENLVAEAYLSFPERFQLEGYPEWPNAHVVGKAWVRCRTDKKWITGSASEGFKLTPLGQQVVQKMMLKLRLKHPTKTPERQGSRQTISSRVVLGIESSAAYRRYKSEGPNGISEYEFCDLLYCTLESTPETVSKNFDALSHQVEAYGRRDLIGFLDEIKGKFASRFVGKRSRGGLMPQKKES